MAEHRVTIEKRCGRFQLTLACGLRLAFKELCIKFDSNDPPTVLTIDDAGANGPVSRVDWSRVRGKAAAGFPPNDPVVPWWERWESGTGRTVPAAARHYNDSKWKRRRR